MGEFILVGVILALGMGAYWALVLFPRQRAFSKRQKIVSNLSPGEEVITYGGIIGKVIKVEPEMGIAEVAIAEGVTVRILMASVVQSYDPTEIAVNAQKGLGIDVSEAEPEPELVE